MRRPLKSTRTTRQTRASRRPLLEPLEPRQLLSASLLSAFALGTTSPYGQFVSGLAVDSTGCILVAGSFAGTLDPSPSTTNLITNNTYSYDMFLCKYSPTGILQWADDLGESGFMGNDMAAAIMVDANDNIILTGSFCNTIDMDPGAGTTNLTSNGGSDIFVAKYDSAGALLWAKSFGGTGDDIAGKLVSDTTGDCYFSGMLATLPVGTETWPIPWNCFLTRLDANGNTFWSDQFPTTTDMSLTDIAADSTGAYVLGTLQTATDLNPGRGTRTVGNGQGYTTFLAKYSPAGQLSWTRQFTGAILPASIALDPQKNIILAGSFGGTADFDPGPATHNLTETQSPDAFTGFVLKLGPAGNFKWAHAFTGDWWSDVFAAATDAAGNIYLTGEFNGTHNFDISGPGQPADTLTALGQDDAFLAKYDPAGHLAWLETIASDGYDHGQHMAIGPANRVYLSGYFNNTAHVGPDNAGQDLSAVGTNDSFIAIYDQTPATPVVTVAAQVVSAFFWHNYRVTITVTPPQGVATGTVTLKDGTHIVARGTLNANGQVVLRVNNLSAGSHTLTATFAGTFDLAPAISSPLLLSVSRLASH